MPVVWKKIAFTGDAPTAHKASHQDTGGDEISVAGLSGLLTADQHVLDAEVKLIKLDDFATPDDNTDLDFGTARHGLVPKGTNVGDFLKDDGSWAAGGTGATLTVAETEVFNAAAPLAWTDLDLSGTIGSQATLVLLKVKGDGTINYYAVRKDGDTDNFWGANTPAACASGKTEANHIVLLVATSTTGKIEWRANTTDTTTIDIIVYIK